MTLTLFDLRGLAIIRPDALADPVQPMPYRVVSTDLCKRPTVFYTACARTRDEAEEIADTLRFEYRLRGLGRRIVIEGDGL